MHIFFSGIGGAAIGPLALIAKQAGYDVSGSDALDSQYISYLREKNIKDIQIGQTTQQIESVHARNPIDWFVYSSALPKTIPNHPELVFCQQHNIKATKRADFLNQIIHDKNLALIAVAGTHGKTTTTAMTIWLFKQLGVPASYSVGAKLSFGDMGHYEPNSKYFIYEADEFDRNFLNFYPKISLITGVDWDHPDIYPTRENYLEAFSEFIDQSEHAGLWQSDAQQLLISSEENLTILEEHNPDIEQQVKLAGRVNRMNAWLVAHGTQAVLDKPLEELVEKLNEFPGVSRRFEQITPNIYSDYAHTPPKIRGALQMAHEVGGQNVVVVYEGLHNTRQHFIKDELANLFDDVKNTYVVPSYLAREDKNLEKLTPEKILDLLSISAKGKARAAQLDDNLAQTISRHAAADDLVLCLSAGGAGSLDEWLRQNFS